MTIELKGNWKKGFAYDVHTLDSVYLGVDEHGHDRWKNTRSEMGQLVYDLKYDRDKSAVAKIVDLLEKYKGIETMDAIVPVPATRWRPIQPVIEIARELGRRTNVLVLENLLVKKTDGPELKNIDDPDERQRHLKDIITISEDYNISGQSVLLVDDLYRSGDTLSVATELLYNIAKVKAVFVLTMTKTRSKR
ncbi:MAG: ComF family protein [bacterium]|nr:ComF family protein [bacterium]